MALRSLLLPLILASFVQGQAIAGGIDKNCDSDRPRYVNNYFRMAVYRDMASPNLSTTGAEIIDNAAEGARIYRRHCASCHGSKGQGTRVGPSLQTVTDPQMVMHMVRSGKGIMPSFANRLTDTQIRAVAHYVARKLTGSQGLTSSAGTRRSARTVRPPLRFVPACFR